MKMFSPRARGCSPRRRNQNHYCDVFPACAGMFPGFQAAMRNADGFPRVRGDVPTTDIRRTSLAAFSPRARGCSDGYAFRELKVQVFPACAGMFLQIPHHRPAAHCFPRVRGDVPLPVLPQRRDRWFSPRARGCSPKGVSNTTTRQVFPACAGMFPPQCS